jgi:hypothetical protein
MEAPAAGDARRFRLEIHFSEAVDEFTQDDVVTSEGCTVSVFSMLRADLYVATVQLGRGIVSASANLAAVAEPDLDRWRARLGLPRHNRPSPSDHPSDWCQFDEFGEGTKNDSRCWDLERERRAEAAHSGLHSSGRLHHVWPTDRWRSLSESKAAPLLHSQRRKQSPSPAQAMKKSVRWSTVTVYEFGVGLGGSAVPRHGGPSIGLAREPKCVWSTPLDEAAVAMATREELAQDEAPAPPKTTKGDARLKNKAKRAPRRRKVRWLKPLERVTMLTKAGCSEKRIYRMMMESSEIAMSRRLTLRVLDI